MGLLTEGAIISEIRGSVGDRTFSRNAYGPYVKQKLIQTNPNTGPQLQARFVFANAVSNWQATSAEVRAAWRHWAKQNPVTNSLGKKVVLSAYNMFISGYINRALIGAFGVQPVFNLTTFPKIGENYLIEEFGDLNWRFETQFPNEDYHWAFYVSPQYSVSNTAVNPSTMRFAYSYPASFDSDFGLRDAFGIVGFPTFQINGGLASWLGLRLIHESTGWASKMYIYKLQSVSNGEIS